MGWDRPAGWVPPAEARAAAEAAEKMAAERADADARTAAITDAIRDGFGMLSTAILAASTVHYGPEAVRDVSRRFAEMYDRLMGTEPDPPPLLRNPPPAAERPAADDADLEDLITPDDGDTTTQ